MSTAYLTYFVHTRSGVEQVLLDLTARLIAKTPLRFEVHYVQNGQLHEGAVMGKNATLADLSRLPEIPDSVIDYECATRIAPRVKELVDYIYRPQLTFNSRAMFLGAGWLLVNFGLKDMMSVVAIPPSLPEIPPLTVRVVSTYTGQFTIGDPRKPLLEFPIKCIPFTREASASKLALTNDSKTTRTATQFTSKGPVDGTEVLEKGFRYLDQFVLVNEETLDIMQGEFEGARVTDNAFELMATVSELPPWVLMEKTDQVLPTDQPGATFLATFSQSLESKGMYAIARRTKRGTAGRKKGTIEILALIPYNGVFMATRLPFDHEYTGFYRFARLQQTPDSYDEELDELMGELVRNSTTDQPIEPIRNEKIVRVGRELMRNVVEKYDPEYFGKDKSSVHDLILNTGMPESQDLGATVSTPASKPVSLLEEGSNNYELSEKIASLFGLSRREQVSRTRAVQKEYYAEPNADINDLL